MERAGDDDAVGVLGETAFLVATYACYAREDTRTPMRAMLVQLAISRAREFHADATGARLAGKPWGLASALEKLDQASKAIPMDATPATAHLFIVNPLSGSMLRSLFSTHPSTEERVARLRAMALSR